MAIKATEISDLIKQRIENFKGVTEARNVGTIVRSPTASCGCMDWPMPVTVRCWSFRATLSAWR